MNDLNNVRFNEFIHEVEKLQRLFGNSSRATLKRFEFNYSFDTVWDDENKKNEDVFCFYISHNGGQPERKRWRFEDFDKFYIYCKALHDLCWSMR